MAVKYVTLDNLKSALTSMKENMDNYILSNVEKNVDGKLVFTFKDSTTSVPHTIEISVGDGEGIQIFDETVAYKVAQFVESDYKIYKVVLESAENQTLEERVNAGEFVETGLAIDDSILVAPSGETEDEKEKRLAKAKTVALSAFEIDDMIHKSLTTTVFIDDDGSSTGALKVVDTVTSADTEISLTDLMDGVVYQYVGDKTRQDFQDAIDAGAELYVLASEMDLYALKLSLEAHIKDETKHLTEAQNTMIDKMEEVKENEGTPDEVTYLTYDGDKVIVGDIATETDITDMIDEIFSSLIDILTDVDTVTIERISGGENGTVTITNYADLTNVTTNINDANVCVIADNTDGVITLEADEAGDTTLVIGADNAKASKTITIYVVQVIGTDVNTASVAIGDTVNVTITNYSELTNVDQSIDDVNIAAITDNIDNGDGTRTLEIEGMGTGTATLTISADGVADKTVTITVA